jgi:predicted esterase
VQHSTEVLRRLGGDVTERLYPGMGHTVNQDEIDAVKALLRSVLAQS